ncbi:MAG: hypothetical protein CL431_07030 [Acidimicrobiaceae bacterium]|nr:hypothetical protein [Acidimicrobiaceae bacterium]
MYSQRTIIRLLSLALSFLLLSSCSDPVIPLVESPPETAFLEPQPSSIANDDVDGLVQEIESGLTDESIRIAVIADGPNEYLNDSEGLSVWQSVEAWAESVNRSTKLAGREVIVDRIDAATFRHVEAIDTAFQGNYFAIVGSFAVNDSDGLDLLQSPDCLLPDFPASTFSLRRLYSGQTFQSNPVAGVTSNAGWASYFAQDSPSASQNASILLPELPSIVLAGERLLESATAQGLEFSYSPIYEIESDFESEAEALLRSSSESLIWATSGGELLRFLETLQRINPDKTFDFISCGQRCYNPDWVLSAGLRGQGVSVWLPHLPIEEAELNDELLRYLFFMNVAHGSDSKPTAAGIAAWSAALLFEEAVSRSVGANSASYKPDNLSQESVIVAAESITFWDARGLHGISNPADAIPSSCFVIMTLDDGLWEREFPRRPGELSCEENNLVELKATTNLEQVEDELKSPE